MIRTMCAALTALLLAGCATPYQSVGLTGGHLEQKFPGTLEMVAFSANGYTSSELSQKYALYRCAELASTRKKPFFLLYSSLIGAARNSPSDIPRVGSALGKPTATAFMLMLDGPQAGAHNTADVIADLQPVIDSGSLSAAP